MVKVSIIGSGNVAGHLASAFEKSDAVELVQVFSRAKTDIAAHFPESKITHLFDSLQPADLYIIAVSDSAIAEVSQKLPFSGRLVVHTSGSLPASVLDNKNRKGVFYPLQTFSKNKSVDFNHIPICLESETDYDTLERVARAISGHIYKIDGLQRRALHVAAVFANNFTNHLYKIGADICAENRLPFDILKPLIAETAAKINVLSPYEAQTGPAKRNDRNTIETHLDFLQDKNRRNLYQTLTQSIIDDGKKL